MSALAASWNQRSPGERRAIAIAGGVVLAAITVSAAWLPLERARTRLAAELPAMRASIEALARDAREVQRLRALPERRAAEGAPLASLATNGGGLAGAQVTVLDARRVRVAGADVAFGGLLEWLRNAQATHGMRVDSAKLDALPAAGRVRVEMILARS